MDIAQWPVVSDELLVALRSKFPEKCIREGESLEEAHRYAGKCELVAFLGLVKESQK